eukprot:tig00001600_g9392.t1
MGAIRARHCVLLWASQQRSTAAAAAFDLILQRWLCGTRSRIFLVVGSGSPRDERTTLAAPHSHTDVIKKSTFIACAAPCSSPEDALAFFESVRDPEARHNCWAYKIGDNIVKFNDDGEPGGTAGRPILAAIEGQGLTDVAVLVVRFFGGIKLGAGGLVRAYGGTAAECLRQAPKRVLTPKLRVSVQVGFDLMGTLYNLIEAHGPMGKEEAEYGEGAVTVRLLVERAAFEAFEGALREASRGAAVVEVLGTEVS